MNVPGITDLSPTALAEAADENFVVHTSWAAIRTPGMRVDLAPDLVVVDSGLPCDTFNFVCRARLEPDAARARAREAVAYFRGVGRPFSWWVGPADRPDALGDVLVSEGLERAETEVAMAADLGALEGGGDGPAALRVERVRTLAQLVDFARVNAANWSPPDPQVMRFYELAAPALLAGDSPQRLYVGYAGGEAVATSELTEGGGVVGLYNVATLEAHRRRGYGSALTLRPLLDARDRGFRAAVLQASADGAGVYARLGFRGFGGVTEYK
jgi:ribosomal protein S18 acetylase RimI-like enzyme